MSSTRERLVVIGSGMAGGKLIEELLQVDPERHAITVIGDEPHGNYNRIKLVVKLRTDNLPDFHIQTPAWYRENGIDTRLGKAVTAIDRQARRVTLDDSSTLPYDRLVLATGSRPFIPPIWASRSRSRT